MFWALLEHLLFLAPPMASSATTLKASARPVPTASWGASLPRPKCTQRELSPPPPALLLLQQPLPRAGRPPLSPARGPKGASCLTPPAHPSAHRLC